MRKLALRQPEAALSNTYPFSLDHQSSGTGGNADRFSLFFWDPLSISWKNEFYAGQTGKSKICSKLNFYLVAVYC